MRYVELNEDTQGIIVACAIDGFVSLEACGRGSKPYNYARVTHGFSDRTVYTFMPLHKGDFIAAAWIREPKHDVSSRQSVLVLNTSFQRTCTFGHYVPTEREHRYRFEPLLKQNAYRITGFCYNDDAVLFSGRLKIGVTYEGKAIGSLTTPPLQAAYTMPKPWIPQWWASSPSLAGASKRRGWNVSSASLARANHVRMFVNNKKSHKPTMGMLLSYEDHQESLGQYRFDCDVEDYDLTGPMCFFSGETILGPYIKIICNSEEKPGWTEIPRAAKLVWWFTDVCSQLDVLTM
ncbi:hypothetical protein COCSADRAFT_34185 [Bipolaris sorokiniana ND90Pr]|uniref:Uncharacterized protein n=1 Tax=Cochliobolus sativus (strain ND90Pr / ATCC 201652) TaxID=665912 RepID=M2RL11_COCSN|nr:uncharacterized protein COCSADRAFT_34185 [Bipolaris sorokiniana ND90Pr]EMD67359.1 hypothetical protein COCSADRAFT_34185 [Bipolaris sorokiniana ND90Pr]